MTVDRHDRVRAPKIADEAHREAYRLRAASAAPAGATVMSIVQQDGGAKNAEWTRSLTTCETESNRRQGEKAPVSGNPSIWLTSSGGAPGRT